MDQNFDVYLKFLVDNKDAASKVDILAASYENFAQRVEAMGPEYARGTEAFNTMMKAYKQEIDSTGNAAGNGIHKLTQQAILFRREAREITSELRLLRHAGQDIELFARPLEIFGAAVTGGIFAAAEKFVKDSKEATETTRQWKAAQDDLNKSGERIGAVLADAALPLLKDAAALTEKIAGILEKNPGLATAALNVGIISLALGTIGKAVSGGIRMYADFKMEEALVLQYKAAQLQLQAAELQAEAAAKGGVGGAAKTAGGLALGVPALVVGGALAGALAIDKAIDSVGKGISSFGPKFQGFGDRFTGSMHLLEQILLPGPTAVIRFAESFPKLLGIFDMVKAKIDKFLGISPALDRVSQSLDQLAGSANEAKIVEAFTKWKDDDAKLVTDAMENRKKILAEGEAELNKLSSDYAARIADINSSSSADLEKITTKFLEDTKKAEEKQAKERADIIKNEGQQIQDIEAKNQDALRKLALEHNRAMGDLLAARDALGLVKEQQKYEDARSEQNRSTNEEIARIKRDTAEKLIALDQQFAEEREQRNAQYRQDVIDNAAKHTKELAAAQAQYQAQIKQQQEAEAKKLQDLDDSLTKERARRREQWIAQLLDLDANLKQERNTKNGYYAAMLADAQAWITQYRATLNGGLAGGATLSGTSVGGGLAAGSGTTTNAGTTSTTSTTTSWGSAWNNWVMSLFGRDTGGYVDKGVYRMAWDGQREFVLNNAATKAAERIIGGNLTQESLMAALGGGGTRQVNYSDQRRFNAGMTAQERRSLRNDTQDLLEGLIKG